MKQIFMNVVCCSRDCLALKGLTHFSAAMPEQSTGEIVKIGKLLTGSYIFMSMRLRVA